MHACLPATTNFCAVVALNMLLTWGHVGLQAVYHIHATEEEKLHDNHSIPLALQALFCKVGGALMLCSPSLQHSAGADQSVCQETAGANSFLQMSLCRVQGCA